MSNLQTYYHFELDFQKVDQYSEGKCKIYDTQDNKTNHWGQVTPLLLVAYCGMGALEQNYVKLQSKYSDTHTLSYDKYIPMFLPQTPSDIFLQKPNPTDC